MCVHVCVSGKFGDCNVPSSQERSKNPYFRLYNWCDHQRYQHRQGLLAQHKVQRLTAVGFSWKGVAYEAWNVKFQELEAFKAHHGHCNVPQHDGALGNWVKKLRTSYAKQTMAQHKIDRLNAIGFVWRIREARNRSGVTATNSTTTKPRPNREQEEGAEETETAITTTTTAAAAAAAAAASGENDYDNNDFNAVTTMETAQPIDRPTSAVKRPALLAGLNPVAVAVVPAPKKTRRARPTMSVACTSRLVQTFTEVSGEGPFQDWVHESLSFLDNVNRTRKVHQQSCLQMACTLQAQLLQWHAALDDCRKELLDLTQPPPVVEAVASHPGEAFPTASAARPNAPTASATAQTAAPGMATDGQCAALDDDNDNDHGNNNGEGYTDPYYMDQSNRGSEHNSLWPSTL